MIGPLFVAELTSEPEAETHPGGHVVYRCDADLEPFGKRVAVVILPFVAGLALPYRKGDRVLLAVSSGTGYILGHFTSATEHDGHTWVTPRDGKEVRLGTGAGAWQPLMLHTQASAALLALKARIDYIADQVATTMNALVPPPTGPLPYPSNPPGPGDTWIEGLEAQGEVTGGEASAGVKGRPA